MILNFWTSGQSRIIHYPENSFFSRTTHMQNTIPSEVFPTFYDINKLKSNFHRYYFLFFPSSNLFPRIKPKNYRNIGPPLCVGYSSCINMPPHSYLDFVLSIFVDIKVLILNPLKVIITVLFYRLSQSPKKSNSVRLKNL